MRVPGAMGLTLERRFAELALPLLPPAGMLVAGVSGGADSLALLQLLCRTLPRAAERIVAVHVHHGLRGVDADRDARAVIGHCRRLGLVSLLFRRDVPAEARSLRFSLEEAGRRARQECLLAAARQWQSRAVLLAHHQDDQAETLLLNLLRGAAGRGLAGLRPVRPFPHPQAPAGLKLLRPLLPFSKQELRAYMRSQGLTWREDRSNRDLQFARNRIRHRLLPYLEKHFHPRSRLLLARSAEILSGQDELLAEQAGRWRKRLLTPGPRVRSWKFMGKPLRSLRQALRLEILSAVWDALQIPGKSHDHLAQLEQACLGQNLARHLPGGWRLQARSGSLRFRQESGRRRGQEGKPEGAQNRPMIFGVKVKLMNVPENFSSVPEAAAYAIMDADKTARRLTLRVRRPGDSMRPLGLGQKRKSLKKIMLEMRIPYALRSGWPILVQSREVIWVYRGPVSESVKLDKTSQKALKIEIFNVADLKSV